MKNCIIIVYMILAWLSSIEYATDLEESPDLQGEDLRGSGQMKVVCIDIGSVGHKKHKRLVGPQSFLVPKNSFSWFSKTIDGVPGATNGECKDKERRIKSGLKKKKTFCIHFGSSKHGKNDRDIVDVPKVAWKYAKSRGAIPGPCSGKRNNKPDIRMELAWWYLLICHTSLGMDTSHRFTFRLSGLWLHDLDCVLLQTEGSESLVLIVTHMTG